MSETKTITVEVFRDPDGKPTCSLVWGHQSCQWVGSRAMGMKEICLLTGIDLRRVPNGVGFLQPVHSCPLWKDEA